jgi:hypothetical protein
MSLRTRRLTATLVAALGLAGAALVSTVGTGTLLAGCPDPRTCGDPSFTHSRQVAAPASVLSVIPGCPDPRTCGDPNVASRRVVVAVGRPPAQVIECPDPNNCTPPR